MTTTIVLLEVENSTNKTEVRTRNRTAWEESLAIEATYPRPDLLHYFSLHLTYLTVIFY